MSRHSNHSDEIIDRAKNAVSSATDVTQLRRALSILLPALLGATIPQAAEAIGVSPATISRLQLAFRNDQNQDSQPPKKSWGGRRNSWMSIEEEKEFLAPWFAMAEKGSLVVASPIRAALAERLGQPIKASVVYRMLARHGWRKVAPDTKHPKSDSAVQDAWKKNSRMIWQLF